MTNRELTHAEEVQRDPPVSTHRKAAIVLTCAVLAWVVVLGAGACLAGAN